MTQNQVEKEIDITELLIKNSRNCYYLLYNIIIELEGKNTDHLNNKELIKLLYSCIVTIFTNNGAKIPSLQELVEIDENNVDLPYNCENANDLIKSCFSKLNNYNFKNLENQSFYNVYKPMILKFMEYIPMDKLEYFYYLSTNKTINEKFDYNKDLFLDFINNKIKNGKKSEINNLIYSFLEINRDCSVVKNLNNEIIKIIDHYDRVFSTTILSTIDVDGDNYICYIKGKLILLILKIKCENYGIENCTLRNNILTFNINYFTHIEQYKINLLYGVFYKK